MAGDLANVPCRSDSKITAYSCTRSSYIYIMTRRALLPLPECFGMMAMSPSSLEVIILGCSMTRQHHHFHPILPQFHCGISAGPKIRMRLTPPASSPGILFERDDIHVVGHQIWLSSLHTSELVRKPVLTISGICEKSLDEAET